MVKNNFEVCIPLRSRMSATWEIGALKFIFSIRKVWCHNSRTFNASQHLNTFYTYLYNKIIVWLFEKKSKMSFFSKLKQFFTKVMTERIAGVKCSKLFTCTVDFQDPSFVSEVKFFLPVYNTWNLKYSEYMNFWASWVMENLRLK